MRAPDVYIDDADNRPGGTLRWDCTRHRFLLVYNVGPGRNRYALVVAGGKTNGDVRDAEHLELLVEELDAPVCFRLNGRPRKHLWDQKNRCIVCAKKNRNRGTDGWISKT